MQPPRPRIALLPTAQMSRPNRPHPLFQAFVDAALNTLPEGSQRVLPLDANSLIEARERALSGISD